MYINIYKVSTTFLNSDCLRSKKLLLIAFPMTFVIYSGTFFEVIWFSTVSLKRIWVEHFHFLNPKTLPKWLEKKQGELNIANIANIAIIENILRILLIISIRG